MDLVGLFFWQCFERQQESYNQKPGVSVILIRTHIPSSAETEKVSKTNEGVKVESKEFFHFLIRGMEASPGVS